MKVLRRIAIGFGTLCFAISLAAVLFVGHSRFGWQALSVPTGSMRPAVSPGSLVLVHRVSDSSLKVGDVITYTNPATMRGTITHRIVRIVNLKHGAPTYITKGDANKSADPLPAIGGLIQGKLIAHVPYAGEVLQWGKTWLAIALFVYVPALLILFEEVRRLSEYFRTGLPYKLYGFRREALELVERRRHPIAMASGVAAMLTVLCGAVFWQPAFALLHTNTVALAPNTISVARTTPPSGGGCSNNTNINVNNSSSQIAQSGSASGGSATSGNASNSNNTNININIKNGC